MIRSLNDVKSVLQLMWPNLGHKPRKRYRKKAYSYSIYHFPSSSLSSVSFNKKITIVYPDTEMKLEINYREMDGEIDYIKSVKVFKGSQPLKEYKDNPIDDTVVEALFLDFAKAFLPIEIWQQI